MVFAPLTVFSGLLPSFEEYLPQSARVQVELHAVHEPVLRLSVFVTVHVHGLDAFIYQLAIL